MKMKNAKQELLDVLSETNKTILCADLCAVIEQGDNDYDEGCTHVVIHLKLNYTTEDYEIFLNNLNFEYDDGFGSQELWGTVWLSNNTWLERGEYDGSEWWNYMSLPVIPDNLKGE